MKRIRLLDVVRTPNGNLGVVEEVSGRDVSLVFKRAVREKVAWWSPKELTYLFNVSDMVDVLDTDTIKELIRLRKGERDESQRQMVSRA